METFGKFLYIGVFIVFFSGCGDAASGAQSSEVGSKTSKSLPAAEINGKCIEVIIAYVDKTRGWNKNSYSIVYEQSSSDAKGFSVRHENDIKKLLPGGDIKSFHVDLDEGCGKVIRELAYQ